MSFAEAVERFGDFDVFVTANERHAPSIIGYLLENGVKSENITNYEPVEKRKGCATVESWISLLFSGEHLEFAYCCRGTEFGCFSDRPKIILFDTMLNNKIFSSILQNQKEIQKDIKCGCPPQLCDDCWWSKEVGYHYVDFKLRQINIGGYAPCNFSCHNCGNVIQWEKCTYNAWDTLLDRFKVIEDSGMVADDCLITLALGEPTIAKNHGEILQHLGRYPLIVFSNAYVWSEPTAEALADGNTWLRVSVDAGTRETFAKIKGVDGFGRVYKNLENYAKYGTLVLKYIVFPELNDDDANLYGFMELADRLNAKVNLSRDFAGSTDISEEFLKKLAELTVHFQNKKKLYGIAFRPNERRRLQDIIQGMERG
jgi:uncharacterized Fe-S cluster-containing radical SAM superfamily protein